MSFTSGEVKKWVSRKAFLLDYRGAIVSELGRVE